MNRPLLLLCVAFFFTHGPEIIRTAFFLWRHR